MKKTGRPPQAGKNSSQQSGSGASWMSRLLERGTSLFRESEKKKKRRENAEALKTTSRTARDTRKVVVCRPLAGLNDMLCQIEKCARYAESHNRLLIVDSNYRGSNNAKVPFSKLFVARDPNLRLDISALDELGPLKGIVPFNNLSELNAYEITTEGARLISSLNHKNITFDFKKSYRQDVLVHSMGGGGTHSLNAMTRLRLHDTLADELLERLNSIGAPYRAIHVRHTDYQSDYKSKIAELSSTVKAKLFVATDNPKVLDDFRAVMGDSVISFSALPDIGGKPLHLNSTEENAFQTMKDAVLDLLLLSLSKQLHVVQVVNGARANKVSGYAKLARYMHQNPAVIEGLIGRPGSNCVSRFRPEARRALAKD